MIGIKEVVAHAEAIANGQHETVKPGMPQAFSEASVEGDVIWQGDLGIAIVDDAIPEDYVKVKIKDLCLVPSSDNSIGSRHCLGSKEGVEMWTPEQWDSESMFGPYLRLSNGADVTHPVHGDVHIPSSFKCIQILYQREYDEELKRERRAKD